MLLSVLMLRLKQVYHYISGILYAQLFLFGSRVRGDSCVRSNVDLALKS